MRGASEMRRLLAVGTAGGVLLLSSGCDLRGKSSEAAGEVAYTWTPPKVETVAGVPAAAIREAIGRHLAGERPEDITAELWTHVQRLYKEYGGSALWMETTGPNRARTGALLGALAEAHTDALDLEEYPLAALDSAIRAVRAANPPTAEQLASADVLLSSAYLALAEDLLSGQIDPASVSQDWHIEAQHERLDSAVVHSLRADRLATGIANMRPRGEDYEALRKSIGAMRERVAAGGWQPVPEGKPLKPGDRDDPARLTALRARLAAEGLLGGTRDSGLGTRSRAARDSSTADASSPESRVPSPAVYDRELAGAVAVYQARHAIGVDSILGDETVKSLNVPADYRLGQVAANLERHRWLPRSLGERYIYVNVPAFRLEAWDSTGKALEMKVIVGQEYEGKSTPVFSDRMETVVFRPYWNVTPDIQAKELAPKIAADPGYLARNNMEYYRDGGETRIRQRPGGKNSLGLVKFLFPNSFNIYLHDTPNRELFGKDVRAFSHGCIRVEKPAELAQWVLGWDAGKVQQAMQNGPDNASVKVPRKLPVYITYGTAYLRDGTLHFGNDLYHRDDTLVKATAAGAAPSSRVVQALEALGRIAKG